MRPYLATAVENYESSFFRKPLQNPKSDISFNKAVPSSLINSIAHPKEDHLLDFLDDDLPKLSGIRGNANILNGFEDHLHNKKDSALHEISSGFLCQNAITINTSSFVSNSLRRNSSSLSNPHDQTDQLFPLPSDSSLPSSDDGGGYSDNPVCLRFESSNLQLDEQQEQKSAFPRYSCQFCF